MDGVNGGKKTCLDNLPRKMKVTFHSLQNNNFDNNEEPTSERSDDVSPLFNDRLCAGPWEKIPRTFAHGVGLFNKVFLFPLCVGASVGVCVLSFVPRTPPTCNRFLPWRRLWRPLICTSIHLYSRPKPF